MSKTTPSDSKPTLFLGFETAALYWRAVHEGRLSFPSPMELTSIPQSCVNNRRTLEHIDLSPLGIRLQRDGVTAVQKLVNLQPHSPADTNMPWEQRIIPQGIAITPGDVLPLHTLVSSQSQRISCRALRHHLMASRLPPRALYTITSEIAVTSPELTLVHLSRSSRTLPLLELACEWSGSYALGPLAEQCIFGRPPLTDITRLTETSAKRHTLRGAAILREILPFVAEGLASPRETEIFLMLTLPAKLGGYGLPKPMANQQIPLLNTPFASFSEQAFFVVDLLWADKRVVLEYDGLADHELTTQQVNADKQRRSLLAALGYTVIVITKRDVKSVQTLDHKAAEITLALGIPLAQADETTSAARQALFAWLFDADHDHLPFGFGYR